MTRIGLISSLALTLPLLIGASAEARPHTAAHEGIVCRGEYQIVEGRAISTPYCEDANLAKIARAHGDNVSASALRNNPATKSEVCRFGGTSSSAWDDCPDGDED